MRLRKSQTRILPLRSIFRPDDRLHNAPIQKPELPAGWESDLENSPRTVAVVEDDPSVRRSIERLLNAHGYQTQRYASAETFLAAESTSTIGCLVLDIHLPGMYGIQLRQLLLSEGSSLPVIFITAVDDEAVEVEALETGGLAYLHKPFAAKLLISAVDQALPDHKHHPDNRTQ